MTPRLELDGLAKTKPRECIVRFLFGGAVTAGTGLVAHHFGPELGGLFLAFPAILPASLTLVKQHDGRRQAVADACGARLGSIGLAAFALVVWSTATTWNGALVLTVATLAWVVVSIAAWAGRYGSLQPSAADHRTARRDEAST
jgi:Protein of unknown function (DUF3147)